MAYRPSERLVNMKISALILALAMNATSLEAQIAQQQPTNKANGPQIDLPPNGAKFSVHEFAQRVRTKYPVAFCEEPFICQTQNLTDEELSKRVIEKYPQYRSLIALAQSQTQGDPVSGKPAVNVDLSAGFVPNNHIKALSPDDLSKLFVQPPTKPSFALCRRWIRAADSL